MINCSNCSKENQDHYKFCLGCGARLAGAAAPARPVAPATPVAAVPQRGGTVVTPSQPQAAAAAVPAASAAPQRGGTVVTPGQSQPQAQAVAPVAVPAASAAPQRGGTVVTPSQSQPQAQAAPLRGGTVAQAPAQAAAPQRSGPAATGQAIGTPPQPSAVIMPSAMAQQRGGTVVTPSQANTSAAPRTGGTVVGASQNNAPPLVTPTSAGIEPSTRTGGTVVGANQRTGTQPEPAAKPLTPLDVTMPVRNAAPPQPAATEPNPPGCSACGMVNPPGFAFCGRCGNRLGPAAPVAAPTPVVVPAQVTAPAPAAAPIAAPTPTPIPTAPRPGLRASLHLLREDGSEGGTLHLEDGPVPFGRDYGAPFDADFYLNPQHCSFTVMPEGVRVDDLSETNGVFRKIEGTIELQHGDTFRVGQELLYYEDLPEPEVLGDGTERMGSPNPGYWGRISVLVEVGRACEAQPIVGTEFQVGRERGDLTFPTDGYVSSSHCRVVADDSGVYLEDRGSSNGTYLRVRSGTVVPFGSLVLIGQQLFHIKPA